MSEGAYSSQKKAPGTGSSGVGVPEAVSRLTWVLGIWVFCKSTAWLHYGAVSPACPPFFSCGTADWAWGLLQVLHHWALVPADESFFHWVNIYISIFSLLIAFILYVFILRRCFPGGFLRPEFVALCPQVRREMASSLLLGILSSAAGSHTPENLCLTQQQNPVIATYQKHWLSVSGSGIFSPATEPRTFSLTANLQSWIKTTIQV